MSFCVKEISYSHCLLIPSASFWLRIFFVCVSPSVFVVLFHIKDSFVFYPFFTTSYSHQHHIICILQLRTEATKTLSHARTTNDCWIKNPPTSNPHTRQGHRSLTKFSFRSWSQFSHHFALLQSELGLEFTSRQITIFPIFKSIVGHPRSSRRSPKTNRFKAPILKEVDTSLHTVRFNGSFMKENEFRQGAGPEVDAAWNSLGVNYRAIAVPVGEAAASGITADQVQINSKYGGGFPANVEGLHHLHCLNLLRQSM